MATAYLEEMIFKFLDGKLTDAEKKQIHSAYDCEREIDEETEDEIKDVLYKYVLRNVAWWKIVDKLKQDLDSDDENEESDDD